MAEAYRYASNIIIAEGTSDAARQQVNSRMNWPKYFEATQSALDDIIKSWTGYGLILCLRDLRGKRVIITPSNVGSCNADAQEPEWAKTNVDVQVQFTPSEWGTTCTGPGASPDEALLHELIHAYRMLKGYTPISLFVPGFAYHTVEEFIAILLTNIHRSARHRPGLRKDHRGMELLYPELSTSAAFLSKIRKHFELVRDLACANYDLSQLYVRKDAGAFNPIDYFFRHSSELEKLFKQPDPSEIDPNLEQNARDLLDKADKVLKKQPAGMP
jgi:hypothetical protein